MSQLVASIHQIVGQTELRVCVKIGENEGLQPVEKVFFDEHHKSIVFVVQHPRNTISL